MRRWSALLTRPRRIELIEEELPEPGTGQALVETRLGSVSVGTELAAYLGNDPRLRPTSYPLMTGYENVAAVVAVGAEVDPRWIGRRVLATYGYHTATLLDVDRLITIPDAVPDELALLAILTADTSRAVEHAELIGAERCLILGAGALGLLTLLNLRRTGIEAITVIDTDPDRLQLPEALGAVVAAPVEIERIARRFDVAFECSAAPTAFALAQETLTGRGRLIVVSDGNRGDFMLTPAFHDKELIIHGANSHPDLPSFAAPFLTEAASGEFDAYRAIFDAEVSFDELPAFFERMANGARVRKPLVRYASG